MNNQQTSDIKDTISKVRHTPQLAVPLATVGIAVAAIVATVVYINVTRANEQPVVSTPVNYAEKPISYPITSVATLLDGRFLATENGQLYAVNGVTLQRDPIEIPDKYILDFRLTTDKKQLVLLVGHQFDGYTIPQPTEISIYDLTTKLITVIIDKTEGFKNSPLAQNLISQLGISNTAKYLYYNQTQSINLNKIGSNDVMNLPAASTQTKASWSDDDSMLFLYDNSPAQPIHLYVMRDDKYSEYDLTKVGINWTDVNNLHSIKFAGYIGNTVIIHEQQLPPANIVSAPVSSPQQTPYISQIYAIDPVKNKRINIDKFETTTDTRIQFVDNSKFFKIEGAKLTLFQITPTLTVQKVSDYTLSINLTKPTFQFFPDKPTVVLVTNHLRDKDEQILVNLENQRTTTVSDMVTDGKEIMSLNSIPSTDYFLLRIFDPQTQIFPFKLIDMRIGKIRDL